jgi:PAS domain S-box-containing protein
MRRGVLAILLVISLNVESAEPRRVLLIHSFGQEFQPLITFSADFRSGLARQSPQPVDFFDVALADARFETREQGAFVNYVEALFAGHRPDLVVPMGAPAVGFAQKYRARLFPDTPMLLAAVDQRLVQSSRLTRNDAVIAVRHDPRMLVEAMLKLMPDTTNVVMVFGNSPLERFWADEFMRESQLPSNHVGCESFSGLSFEQMKRRAAALHRGSVMLFGDLMVDAEGIPQTGDEALANLHAVANVPIFGIHDFQLGHGIVGGPLVPVHELALQSASAAARILQGESPASFRPPPIGATVPTYDWRELRRWGISQDRLPPRSIVKYRVPAVWERYEALLATIASVVLVQLALILCLAFNLRWRRKAERALRESEWRFRMVADSAPVFIWMAGTDRKCVFVNQSWLEFTGCSMEEELGSGWAEGIHPDDVQRCLKICYTSFDARQPFEMEYRLRRHDGEYRWVLDRGVPRYSGSGDFLGYVGVAMDLTDRKLMEESRQKLIHVSRLAVVGELTTMIAHELNQPLTAMRLNLDVVKTLPETAAVAEVRDILADIRADNVRAAEAIRRIRTLVSKHEMEMRIVDLNAIVLEAANLAKADVIARRGVQFHVECNAPCATVRGDSVHLQQVVLNLIVNGLDAVKGIAQADRHLYVSTSAGVDGYVEVKVKDTGHGIEPENLSRVFESFFTTKPDGMGMGLSLARSIVQLHSGRLWAENNRDGNGSTFCFILPIAAAEPPPPVASESRDGAAAEKV